jgi:hypothetical protein
MIGRADAAALIFTPVSRAGGHYYVLDGQPVGVTMGDFLIGAIQGFVTSSLAFEGKADPDQNFGPGNEHRSWPRWCIQGWRSSPASRGEAYELPRS